MFERWKAFKRISYYGFPVGMEQKKAPGPKNRGIALLIALMAIMLMVGVVADMIVTSTVNIELAIASRDRIRAEYLAKSGFNFAVFILSISWGYDLFLAQSTTPAIMKKDLSDDSKSLWAIANKLPPIGALTVELLKTKKDSFEKTSGKSSEASSSADKSKNPFDNMTLALGQKTAEDEQDDDDPFKLKGMMNEEVAEEMKLFEDSFSLKIIDEASKINVNECALTRCTEIIQMLTALFSCPAEKAFLESKNLTPEQLAYRIKDYISNSTSTSPESGFGDKNIPYQEANPPYTVKGVSFDSVDELHLVAGWDDELHKVFAPYLTVYPFPTTTKTQFNSPININTVKPELLSCLIPDSRTPACAESFAQKIFEIKKENTVVFKESIKSTLGDLTCLGSAQGEQTDASGQKIDPTTWFDKKSSVFRIVIDSMTGKQSRKLISVVRRIMPQDKSNQRDQQPVKRSYQILHWKML